MIWMLHKLAHLQWQPTATQKYQTQPQIPHTITQPAPEGSQRQQCQEYPKYNDITDTLSLTLHLIVTIDNPNPMNINKLESTTHHK